MSLEALHRRHLDGDRFRVRRDGHAAHFELVDVVLSFLAELGIGSVI
jgi:hypothetical protein